jgi:hypothetical protein
LISKDSFVRTVERQYAKRIARMQTSHYERSAALGLLSGFPAVLVFPGFRCRDSDIRNGFAIGCVANLGIFTQISNQNDLVDTRNLLLLVLCTRIHPVAICEIK